MNFRLNIKTAILFIPLLGSFLVPSVTHASFWSAFSSLFSGQDVSAQSEQVITADSNSIVLLEGATSIDPSLKINPFSVTDGGESLLSEVGPSTISPEQTINLNDQISTYIIRKGDTFAGISKMFGVSVNTILWANDLTKNSTLKEGQTLVILPISGVIHDVVRGDTLSSIAKKYGGNIDEIAQFNDMAINANLAVGDQIIIPDGEVSSSITTSSTGTKTKVAYNVPNYNGYYVTPWAPGSPRVHQTQGLHGYHNSAVDYGMPVGTPLRAAASGIVIISRNSGWNGGYGNYVIIQHPNGTQTIYGHMTKTTVSVGQRVSQGDPIGYSGNTGNSTGPHLHFEVRGAKNPFNFM